MTTIDTTTSPAGRPDGAACVRLRTYVIDTSVLLSDPWALLKFAEHKVVLPVVVVSELEGKRQHPELGWFARQALNLLEDFRRTEGRLDRDITVTPEGGTLRVELNHSDESVLPAGLRLTAGSKPDGADNDRRILTCALNLSRDGDAVTLVTKDVPLRVKAGSVGLDADEYRAQDVVFTGYDGMARAEVRSGLIDELYAGGVAGGTGITDDLPVHCGVQLVSGSQSILARVAAGGVLQQVPDREAFGLRGRSARQRIALDLLLDEQIGIVSLGGSAGTGKSALALCAGLEAVLERRTHRRIVVFRPVYAVGGQDLGFLPGDADEKMNPWAQAVYDTLEGIVSDNVLDEIADRELLEVLPLTHIRGRSLNDSFVIVDEAQSLERNVLLTVLSRTGRNSRVVLTHDVAQRDNLRVGRHDGIQAVIEKLKGEPLFAHITLTRSERSVIAALVTDMLEQG
jgi:PhoH-like ATPase